MYLADKVISCCQEPVVTVTKRDGLTNVPGYIPVTGISTHEEADILMIPHAVNEKPGNEQALFTKDRDKGPTLE